MHFNKATHTSRVEADVCGANTVEEKEDFLQWETSVTWTGTVGVDPRGEEKGTVPSES